MRVAEALVLLRTLCAHNLGRLTTRLDEGARKTLKEMVGRGWGGGGGAGLGLLGFERCRA